MNLYLINNKQKQTPTMSKGAYYCAYVLVKAETKNKAMHLIEQHWFTATNPVMVDDDVKGKREKIVHIVLKPIGDE